MEPEEDEDADNGLDVVIWGSYTKLSSLRVSGAIKGGRKVVDVCGMTKDSVLT